MDYHVYKSTNDKEYDLEVVSHTPVPVHERYTPPVPGLQAYVLLKFSSESKQYVTRISWRAPDEWGTQISAGARELARLHSVLGDRRRISKLLDKAYDGVKP